jgi:hypothetical protein
MIEDDIMIAENATPEKQKDEVVDDYGESK